MTAADATRLAGEAYCTRLAHSDAAMADDKTRLAQEGYQSKLAREAAVQSQPDVSEYYKIGDKIGDRYEVSAIHHGAMGVVYGCFDHQTRLPCALKTVRACHLRDKQVLSAFEGEAAVWVSLENHPYIVRAYLVERFKNLPYVITEYVRGPEDMEGDLRGWLGHPRLTLHVAVGMALQIAQGMQHAVRKVPNLVHRDLKPANILVNGDGKAMVTDFGLVRAEQSNAGTPAYMSPEQWRADAPDLRSDIYAYGCILFEMFTAHRLFPALAEREWERAHLESTPAALTSIVPELPREIDEFVRRCLEKDVVARPQNWDEVVAFFAEWYHRLTGKAVVFDFSSLVLDTTEMMSVGYSLHNLKKFEEALPVFEKALDIDADDVDIWFMKGLTLADLKRYEEALCAYDKARMLDPNYGAVWHNMSKALKELKRHDDAFAAYDQAFSLDPNYPHALYPNNASRWFDKGNILYKLNRYDEAIQFYDKALTIDPTFIHAYVAKGKVLRDLGRFEDAIQAFDKVLEIDPKQAEIWLNKGAALAAVKRHEEAIEAYARAIAIDANYFAAWYNKGNVLYGLSRYDEAIGAYDRAVAIDLSATSAVQARNAAAQAKALASLRQTSIGKKTYRPNALMAATAPKAVKTGSRPWYSWLLFWDK